jgi:hypothetical protein
MCRGVLERERRERLTMAAPPRLGAGMIECEQPLESCRARVTDIDVFGATLRAGVHAYKRLTVSTSSGSTAFVRVRAALSRRLSAELNNGNRKNHDHHPEYQLANPASPRAWGFEEVERARRAFADDAPMQQVIEGDSVPRQVLAGAGSGWAHRPQYAERGT